MLFSSYFLVLFSVYSCNDKTCEDSTGCLLDASIINPKMNLLNFSCAVIFVFFGVVFFFFWSVFVFFVVCTLPHSTRLYGTLQS